MLGLVLFPRREPARGCGGTGRDLHPASAGGEHGPRMERAVDEDRGKESGTCDGQGSPAACQMAPQAQPRPSEG